MGKKISYIQILQFGILLIIALFVFSNRVSAVSCPVEGEACNIDSCPVWNPRQECAATNTCGIGNARCDLMAVNPYCICRNNECVQNTFCGDPQCINNPTNTTCYITCPDCNNTAVCQPELCEPNCNCSPYTCIGEPCNDGCGGMCEGTKDCSVAQPTATNPVIPPSSTPPPNLSCNCDSIDVIGNLAPGQPVSFTAKAKVNDFTNNQARVKEMIFYVETGGIQIANSGNLSTSGPQTIGNNLYYTSSWNYTIPQTGSGTVSYKVSYNWICDQRISHNIPANMDNSNVGRVAGLWIAQGSRTIQFESYNPNTSLQKSCQELTFNIMYP